MITLVLEASTYAGSVAILRDGELVAERTMAMRGRDQQTGKAVIRGELNAAEPDVDGAGDQADERISKRPRDALVLRLQKIEGRLSGALGSCRFAPTGADFARGAVRRGDRRITGRRRAQTVDFRPAEIFSAHRSSSLNCNASDASYFDRRTLLP